MSIKYQDEFQSPSLIYSTDVLTHPLPYVTEEKMANRKTSRTLDYVKETGDFH